jgi:predicted TIM-barrel fold metal-dependent hydrolase
MRGLRFHLLQQKPGYVRGVGLDVFEVFRRTMAELGWVMQIFCDGQVLHDMAPTLREIVRDLPVIVDHYGMADAARGVNEPNFQALLKLVGEGAVHVKVSAPYRVSTQFPDYADARLLHEALVRANPERLMWGTDWPHPSIAAAAMPDDGHLLDLFLEWTPDADVRRKILVETPQRLFGN